VTSSAKVYVILSGAIFFFVAVFHLLRLLNHWPIVVGGTSIPIALSYFGLPASAAYCTWAVWLLARRPKGNAQ
jgi:hypothetical protein